MELKFRGESLEKSGIPYADLRLRIKPKDKRLAAKAISILVDVNLRSMLGGHAISVS
jgi:hypothetical protein